MLTKKLLGKKEMSQLKFYIVLWDVKYLVKFLCQFIFIVDDSFELF